MLRARSRTFYRARIAHASSFLAISFIRSLSLVSVLSFFLPLFETPKQLSLSLFFDLPLCLVYFHPSGALYPTHAKAPCPRVPALVTDEAREASTVGDETTPRISPLPVYPERSNLGSIRFSTSLDTYIVCALRITRLLSSITFFFKQIKTDFSRCHKRFDSQYKSSCCSSESIEFVQLTKLFVNLQETLGNINENRGLDYPTVCVCINFH